jgi:hypothetical protein
MRKGRFNLLASGTRDTLTVAHDAAVRMINTVRYGQQRGRESFSSGARECTLAEEHERRALAYCPLAERSHRPCILVGGQRLCNG